MHSRHRSVAIAIAVVLSLAAPYAQSPAAPKVTSPKQFFGHDIGGFLGSPSPELFLRWMTFSAYTPLFRNHAINTSERREPWAFGEPYLSMARNIINERYRLIPRTHFVASSDIAKR